MLAFTISRMLKDIATSGNTACNNIQKLDDGVVSVKNDSLGQLLINGRSVTKDDIETSITSLVAPIVNGLSKNKLRSYLAWAIFSSVSERVFGSLKCALDREARESQDATMYARKFTANGHATISTFKIDAITHSVAQSMAAKQVTKLTNQLVTVNTKWAEIVKTTLARANRAPKAPKVTKTPPTTSTNKTKTFKKPTGKKSDGTATV